MRKKALALRSLRVRIGPRSTPGGGGARRGRGSFGGAGRGAGRVPDGVWGGEGVAPGGPGGAGPGCTWKLIGPEP